jgi:hypothetical protein
VFKYIFYYGISWLKVCEEENKEQQSVPSYLARNEGCTALSVLNFEIRQYCRSCGCSARVYFQGLS